MQANLHNTQGNLHNMQANLHNVFATRVDCQCRLRFFYSQFFAINVAIFFACELAVFFVGLWAMGATRHVGFCGTVNSKYP